MIRWQEPAVQVRGLILGGVVAFMVMHHGGWLAESQGKNKNELGWTHDGVVPRAHMGFELGAGMGCAGRAGAVFPDARQLCELAATADGWRFLTPRLRDGMRELPAGLQHVAVEWSGASTGSPAELARRPYGIVIGNGTRSDDGEVSLTGATQKGALRLCLVGEGTLTAAQIEALGEVLHFLRIRSSHLAISVPRSAPSRYVAGGS